MCSIKSKYFKHDHFQVASSLVSPVLSLQELGQDKPRLLPVSMSPCLSLFFTHILY